MCQRRDGLRVVKDCRGICRGRPGYGARPGCDGVCVGGSTGKPLDYRKDMCGKCGGNNDSCTDCDGVVNGRHRQDSCGVCRDRTDPAFDACVKITKVRPTTANAKGGTKIIVAAAGLKNFKVAKCSFRDSENK